MLRNPTMVYPVKMEYIPKITIFGLKMMVKSGLEKYFYNSSMRKPFSFYFIEKGGLSYKFDNKINAHVGMT